MSARGHPADRRRDGLVHGRRRLRAGDVATRAIIVQQPGHDLSRRPAAGEGRDRRRWSSAEELGGADVHTPHLRRRRSSRRERRARARASRGASSRNLNRGEARRISSCARRASRSTPAEELYGIVPRRHAHALRRARGHRAHRRRLASSTSSRRSTARRWSPASRTSTATRSASSPTTASCSARVGAQGRALHRAVQPAQHSAGVPAEHHRLHGRQEIRARRHRQGRRQDGDGGRHRQRAEVHRDHRRHLRRRQLRHVRPRLRAALPVDVAERAHLGDGRRAGGERARDRAARRHRGRRARRWTRRTTKRRSRRRSASSTSGRAIRTTRPRGCGTTASSTRPTRARVLGLALSAGAERAAARADALRRLPDVTVVSMQETSVHRPLTPRPVAPPAKRPGWRGAGDGTSADPTLHAALPTTRLAQGGGEGRVPRCASAMALDDASCSTRS